MALPRTFVSFSSTDLHSYYLMMAWKAHEHIEFNFCNCSLHDAISSENEEYIKRQCRARIEMASRFVLLIGQDTRWKYKYVRWEAEVAKEKGCTIIGVNLDRSRRFNHELTPPIIRDIGVVFVPFSPQIVAHALSSFVMPSKGNLVYPDIFYQKLGYVFEGDSVHRPKWPEVWR